MIRPCVSAESSCAVRRLRYVVIVAHHRDELSVAAANDDRANGLARLHAVGGLVLDLLRVRVDVAVARVARRRVLTRRVAHAVGAVDHRGARANLAVRLCGDRRNERDRNRDQSDEPPPTPDGPEASNRRVRR